MSIQLLLPSATPQLPVDHERASHRLPLPSFNGYNNGNGGYELPFSTFFAMLSDVACHHRKGRPVAAGHQLDLFFLGAT